MAQPIHPNPIPVVLGPHGLNGFVGVPEKAKGLVIFAHGSGSGRFSPRNNHVARRLEANGFATLLLDLLAEGEEHDRAKVFDIPLLASRLLEATDAAENRDDLGKLPVGYFGASTGAGAALTAAAAAQGRVRAIVSRGGRPDLAREAIGLVTAPTLLLVGSLDTQVLELNRWALSRLRCEKRLTIIPGASHLFEEPGTLDRVVEEAIRWFGSHLRRHSMPHVQLPFANRVAAGQALAAALRNFKDERPLVMALPRGGVPVAFEIAKALEADLDLLLVRKLGAPGHPEFGIGAVIDGDDPQIVLNEPSLAAIQFPTGYVQDEARRQLREIERRRAAYLGDRTPIPVGGRTVIVVDDGIATGGTVRAALQAIRRKGPAKLVLAVPIAPRDVIRALESECDEVVCLAMPEPFMAVGAHYLDFGQTSDVEVNELLQRAATALA